jgi:hypothetical protein
MPRRAKDLRSSLVASESSCGMSVSSISTIVTSVPKRSKIDANSHPMMPPPRTTRRRGTSVWERRPVESTQRGDSSPGMGGVTGYEPVATIADLKLIPRSPLSNAKERASSKRALPWNEVTLFALKSDATPPVICFTTCAFHSLAAAKSSSGFAVRTPSFALISRAAWSACAVDTQAFVGMQPMRRHVPPSSASRSTHATRAPSCAARIAAV